MCNCIKKVSNAAVEYAVSNMKADIDEQMVPFTNNEAWLGLENYCFGIGSPIRLQTSLIYKSHFRKKDGSRSRPLQHHISIKFTYCPFCGEKYNADTDSNNLSNYPVPAELEQQQQQFT